MGYRLLLNEWVKLQRDGETIYLAGIDDAHYYRMENFHRAAQDIPAGTCSILLSHTPEAYRHAAHADFNLMLSGHTHGGQVWVPGLGTPVVPSRYGQKYAGGLCQGPHCPVLVSRGVGMAILPVRFGVPPEIGLVTMVRA